MFASRNRPHASRPRTITETPETPRTAHDALFKHIFSQAANAADELRAVLPPELVRQVKWETLRLAQASVVRTALALPAIVSVVLYHGKKPGSWLERILGADTVDDIFADAD